MPEGEAVDEDEVVRVTSNLVIIPASVVDQRGRAVMDLKVEDFELKIDGQVKPIGDFGRAETPVYIALLFDNSESLSEARELEKQAAVRFFQSVVRPIDRAAVYSISTVPVLAQPLTNDVQRLVRTVENFGQPDGATALFDSIAQAADYMRAAPGRKVLVLVSDGTDTVSDVQFEEAVNRALRAECQVYVVQTRQVEDPSLRDTVSEQRMLKLSEQTGGAVYAPQKVEELDDAFAQISLDLSQQYLLGYYPQDGRKDKLFRFISVRVKTRPALRVRARKGFYPDAAQAGGAGPVPESAPHTVPARETREAAAGVAPAKAGRPQAEPLRKQGPAGPDDEERPRSAPRAGDAAETAPTFTLTTATSNVVTAAAPSYDPPPVITPTPTPVPTTTPRQVTPAPTPVPTPAAKAPTSGGVLNAKAMNLPTPFYPQAARNAGAEGTVVIEVVIDELGKVAEARALSGHPLLRPSALIAAKQAKFTPTRLSGEPVRVKGTINYVFALPK
ncbi:MAG TPA: VWA domain-containing protein [Pyrinomonadaceae bacterium]|nr:VWA domain-containing protein [Pyrinomonadaceae bacterium]